MIGYMYLLREGQTHASMLRCASNGSARVVMCGSFRVVSMSVYVINQSINQNWDAA